MCGCGVLCPPAQQAERQPRTSSALALFGRRERNLLSRCMRWGRTHTPRLLLLAPVVSPSGEWAARRGAGAGRAALFFSIFYTGPNWGGVTCLGGGPWGQRPPMRRGGCPDPIASQRERAGAAGAQKRLRRPPGPVQGVQQAGCMARCALLRSAIFPCMAGQGHLQPRPACSRQGGPQGSS